MFAMKQQNAGELLRPKKLVNSSILSHCGEWIEWASSLSPLLGQRYFISKAISPKFNFLSGTARGTLEYCKIPPETL